jgi:cholesterol transport system auxiliary component
MIRPNLHKPGLHRSGLRLATLAFAALALSGCISLLPKSKPAQLYRFGPAPVANAPAPAADAVAVFRARGHFQDEAADDRILTVTGGQAAYIAQSRWVAPAETLFNEAVNNAFDASPIRLLGRGQQGRYAYAIRIDVRTFEARYDAGSNAAPTVVVRLHAALTRNDQSPVGEQDFEVHATASRNRVGAIVAAFDKASKDAIGQLVAWTETKAT